MNEIALMREIAKLQGQIDALRTIQTGGIWTAYTPTLTGWSSEPTAGVYRYCVVGKLCTVMIYQPNDGTSDSTTTRITVPKTAGASGYWIAPMQYRDNGSTSTTPGFAQIPVNGTYIGFYTTWSGGAWTASGAKRIANCVITYEIAQLHRFRFCKLDMVTDAYKDDYSMEE